MMKAKNKVDFSANPHNVQIGDWVVQGGQRTEDKGQRKVVGEVVDRVNNNGDMLQFWVVWFDGNSKIPSPELAQSLVKIPASEDGYVGKSIAQGLIKSMVWQDEQIKYEVIKDSETPLILTRSQVESAIRQSSLNVLNFARNTINLAQVIIDHNLQQRVKLDHSVINDYAIAYQEGMEFPPITIWKCTDEEGNIEDNSVARSPLSVPRYYLVDGFHRVAAVKQAGIEELPFIEKSGTYREALLFSLSVNATHGLRRSNADKRKAVMTLLNDKEWSNWSNRTIAKKCQVSASLVDKLRNEFLNNHNLTANKSSGNHNGNEEVTRIYITKDGVEGKMRVGNIGKGKSSESFIPAEDNEIIPEQFEDIEVTDFEENNYIDDEFMETDVELIDFANTKLTKGKQKITNPLFVGDRVKVKDGHYFGGREGVVTQISSPTAVLVAFDDEQREFIRLKDLDLPELSKPQKPQKKEILIKEGLNYKAGEGCKWYVEVEEEVYKGLQIYQKKVSTPTLNGACSRFLVEKGILKHHPDNPTKLLDLKDTKPTLKTLNISVTTLNLLQQYVNQHGEYAIVRLLAG